MDAVLKRAENKIIMYYSKTESMSANGTHSCHVRLRLPPVVTVMKSMSMSMSNLVMKRNAIIHCTYHVHVCPLIPRKQLPAVAVT